MNRFNYLNSCLTWKEKVWLTYSTVVNQLLKIVPKNVLDRRDFLEKMYQYESEYEVKIVNDEYYINHKQSTSKFVLRDRSSDPQVFRQIWVNEEFRPVVNIVNQRNIKIETILDAGANIGLSTIYLKKHFPQAQVICVEPDKSNVSQLNHNLVANCLADYTILEGGVWSHQDWLDIDYSFRDGLEWSRALKPPINGSGAIPVFSIEDIRKQNGWSTIDLLKIDVEGTEEEIFGEDKDYEFLSKTKVITLEIHDTEKIAHRIINILQTYNFGIYISGELMIGIKDTS